MSRSLLRCSACRHSLLRSFAALAGIQVPPPIHRPLPRQLQPATPRTRTFASAARRQQLDVEPAKLEASHSDAAQPAPAEPSKSAQTSESIPWYLQVSSPTPPAPISPLLALQEIPPLPHNPPTILSPILNHLSFSAGLDNLSLIDLRHLDPPPALGSNLIMIIGTARSVKHLNVSADRFCRWLRTEWGLRPYADGLLGRNELKLKLRRKARRQKMMGLVGGREVVSEDDGITTGWVCVNVGAVDVDLKPRTKVGRGEVEAEEEDARSPLPIEPRADEDFEDPAEELEQFEDVDGDTDAGDTYAGFGSRSTSPRIVVQMFTEEKRLEMDLEGLWEWRNTRRTTKGEQREAEAVGKLKMKGLTLEDDSTEELNDGWEDLQTARRERPAQPAQAVKAMKQTRSVFGD